MQYVITVAVEHYQDPGISRVHHAENDAEGIAEAIILHNPDAQIEALTSAQATKARIESAVRTASRAGRCSHHDGG